jgi:O-methyltransferase
LRVTARCGWFEDTLKDFHEPIAVAFLDVDLAASTRTCLKYLYPRITEGGVLFSHDGYMPLVRAVFADTQFWEQEVGCRMPTVEGLGRRKLLRIVKTSEGP